jgi:hypothetical protein
MPQLSYLLRLGPERYGLKQVVELERKKEDESDAD